jgi:hypothetical protein
MRSQEVDRVFRNKVRAGLFTDRLMRDSMHRHAEALRPYFKEFRAIAHHFLRCDHLSHPQYMAQDFTKSVEKSAKKFNVFFQVFTAQR